MINFNRFDKLKKESGLTPISFYRVVNYELKELYIGVTTDVKRRRNEHLKATTMLNYRLSKPPYHLDINKRILETGVKGWTFEIIKVIWLDLDDIKEDARFVSSIEREEILKIQDDGGWKLLNKKIK